MKKLPALKSETRALLDAAYPAWGDGLKKTTQANTDANAYPPLADFIVDLGYCYRWEAGDSSLWNGEKFTPEANLEARELFRPKDSLDDMEKFMGMLSSTALACGDVAFFQQVAFMTGEKTICRKNSDTLTAYRYARRMAQRRGGPTALPHAGEGAIALDSIANRDKGSTPAETFVDLCNRQALKLPLAKGRRGPSKKDTGGN